MLSATSNYHLQIKRFVCTVQCCVCQYGIIHYIICGCAESVLAWTLKCTHYIFEARSQEGGNRAQNKYNKFYVQAQVSKLKFCTQIQNVTKKSISIRNADSEQNAQVQVIKILQFSFRSAWMVQFCTAEDF